MEERQGVIRSAIIACGRCNCLVVGILNVSVWGLMFLLVKGGDATHHILVSSKLFFTMIGSSLAWCSCFVRTRPSSYLVYGVCY